MLAEVATGSVAAGSVLAPPLAGVSTPEPQPNIINVVPSIISQLRIFILLDEARTLAATAGAAVIVDAAGRLTAQVNGARQPEPWHPLSAREFEIAQLVAAGLTNRQIAQQLVLAPKTISAHVTHILAKLGAARRAEIAAWCATVRSATRKAGDHP